MRKRPELSLHVHVFEVDGVGIHLVRRVWPMVMEGETLETRLEKEDDGGDGE